jgi:predicted nuclease with RNAse H fold
MEAIGIDLAGVESRPTGFCLMDANLLASTCLLYNDREIIHKTVKCKPDVVAIDAPLSLPRGRESLWKRSNVHLRECDRELLKMKIKFFPLTIGPMRQLTERGMRLKAELENRGMTVIETYPGAAQDILHIPRKGKGLNRLEEGLISIGIKGLMPGMSADALDAVTCAFVGVKYLGGEHRAIGDPDEIQMILPQ